MKANHGNYGALTAFLTRNNIKYYKLNEHQYRILGPVALVDVWPARMTVHVISTESVDPMDYFRIDYEFNSKQLDAILNGKEWRDI